MYALPLPVKYKKERESSARNLRESSYSPRASVAAPMTSNPKHIVPTPKHLANLASQKYINYDIIAIDERMSSSEGKLPT